MGVIMKDINLTRLPGYDVNGNPRYVCHYTALLTSQENGNPELAFRWYQIAINRAHSIGGKRYRAKSYGGGIVFTDYENVIKAHIKRIVEEAEQAQIDAQLDRMNGENHE